MAVNVEITRQLGDFKLDIRFSSHARRIGILGASGCGKSMTLKSIAGIELPDSGRIEISGRVFFDKEKKVNLKPQKRNVGYLFQNYALFPTMTVAQNIAAGLKGNKAENEKTGAGDDPEIPSSGAGKNTFPGSSREDSSSGLRWQESWPMSRM